MALEGNGGSERVRVLFQPSGRRGWVPRGTTVLDAARLLGVGIAALCSGCQTCGKCKVKIVEGFFEREGIDSSLRHCLPAEGAQPPCLSPQELARGYRLACASVVGGELAVLVPPESEAAEQVVRKEASRVELDLDPGIEAVAGTLPAASGAEEPLRARLGRSILREGTHQGALYFHESVLEELASRLGPGEQEASFVVVERAEVIRVDFFPPGRRRLLGLAVDLGTTTIVGLLCDLETGELVAHHSLMNPQIQFGEDVLARITYAGAAAGNRAALAQAAREALNAVLRETCRIAGCDAQEVVAMTVVGNPTMHHLALGLDPSPMGRTPYQPVLTDPVSLYARCSGLDLLPCAQVHFLPLRSGFVGADTIAGALACRLRTRPGVTLFVDVGTNGEIVLATPEGLFAAACATGPAFEGAHISCGMRAAEGAIEGVRIDPRSLEVELKVIGESGWGGGERVAPWGICGSGIIDAVAEMLRLRILAPTGAFAKEREHWRLVGRGATRAFVLVDPSRSATGKALAITAKDVRAVQVGKAALYAGAQVLMAKAAVSQVDRILLAGAFGNYIDPVSALSIGMLPDCPLESVVAVGNAAGDGATKALLDSKVRREAVRLRDELRYVELTQEESFSRLFTRAMHLPHMSDRFRRFEESLGRAGWARGERGGPQGRAQAKES